jgi:hypothetical protein
MSAEKGIAGLGADDRKGAAIRSQKFVDGRTDFEHGRHAKKMGSLRAPERVTEALRSEKRIYGNL